MYEILGKIITWILPYLIKKADKYVPILLDNLIQKILNKREESGTKMATIKILVETDATIPVAIAGANVSVLIGSVKMDYTTQNDGTVEKSGFTNGVEYTFTATKTGYTPNSCKVIASEDGEMTGVIKLVSNIDSAVKTVEKAIVSASTNSTTTVSDDWKTIKAAAENAISGLTTSLGSSDLSDSTALTAIYSQVSTVINTAITRVDAYKSQLMISRHSKGFWECVLIDAKLSGITIFEYFVAKEVSAIKAKIEAKISALTK